MNVSDHVSSRFRKIRTVGLKQSPVCVPGPRSTRNLVPRWHDTVLRPRSSQSRRFVADRPVRGLDLWLPVAAFVVEVHHVRPVPDLLAADARVLEALAQLA